MFNANTPARAQGQILRRRNFLALTLQTGLALSAATALPTIAWAQSLDKAPKKELFRVPDEAKRAPLFALNRSHFAPHLGSEFRISNDLSLTLVEINSLTARPGADPAREYERCFSLVFRGPQQQTGFSQLRARTYKLHHEQLGNLEIYLTPVGSNPVWQFYEAVFNRLD